MAKTWPRYARVTSLSIAALLATACGGSGGNSGESDSPATGSPPPPTAPAPTPPPPAPSPPPADPAPPPQIGDASTPVITGVTFNAASHQRAAEGSDNWPVTWSDDDHQYAVWGDGGGFEGTENDGRASFGVARIEGDARNYDGVNLFGGKDGACDSTIAGKGHGAPISIGGVLYAWITPGAGAQGYEDFTLHRSRDKGCHWTKLDVSFVRSRDHISYGSFVQFGRD